MMKNKILSLLLLMVFSILPYCAMAQCAMCKATSQNSGYAKSLNTGILYLLFFPIAVIFGGGLLWYKNRKKFIVSDWDEQEENN
ncbi:MAG: hypothetical protein M9888_02650 [Chitinophagales bacterium]|nr:hypothetical protein [Chitinophagales bacterium]